jgi:hypothetical protein
MGRTLAIVFPCLFLGATAAYAQTGNSKTTDRAQLLTTGRITKIDTKKRTLKVRTVAEATNTSRPQSSGRRGGSGRGGSGRRSGGIGFPIPGGGGRGPSTSPKDQGKEFKVIVTDKTAIKNGAESFSFLNLNVGDRISILGLPKGKGDDLEATEITLTNR